MRDEVPVWLRISIVGGTAAALLVLELRLWGRLPNLRDDCQSSQRGASLSGSWQLRVTQKESKLRRSARNLAIAAGAAMVMETIERPLAKRIAHRFQDTGIAHVAAKVVLLDYGLYLWHVLTHKIPFLWRFHLVHHVDLDLDASTALRFHFGEMLLSVPWRVAQIAVIGAGPLAVSWWQTLLLASILFHHSNVRLPLRYERLLRFAVMTPRLHGIHHRAESACTNSNWSSGLAIWDILHGTYRWNEDDQQTIGVPDYRHEEQVTLPECLTLPFRNVPQGFDSEEEITPRATVRP